MKKNSLLINERTKGTKLLKKWDVNVYEALKKLEKVKKIL